MKIEQDINCSTLTTGVFNGATAVPTIIPVGSKLVFDGTPSSTASTINSSSSTITGFFPTTAASTNGFLNTIENGSCVMIENLILSGETLNAYDDDGDGDVYAGGFIGEVGDNCVINIIDCALNDLSVSGSTNGTASLIGEVGDGCVINLSGVTVPEGFNLIGKVGDDVVINMSGTAAPSGYNVYGECGDNVEVNTL